MTVQFDDFLKTLNGDMPPSPLSIYLTALWFDAKGHWEKAHNIIDSIEEKNAYWVHAYLHRKEGDISNADYWYRRAGKKITSITLQKEWEEIVLQML